MENKSIIENNDYLSFLGIYIPHKEDFPTGYIKLYPEDFIVEEVDERGKVITIERLDSTDSSLPQESKFFHATLVKCNIRTNEALEEIAKQINCDLRQIQSAGLKDEDAITAQKISFEKISLSSIKKITSPHFFIKNIHVGSKRIYNGTHQGNKFTILVRCEVSKIDIKENAEVTFFNYYYTQRFAIRYASHIWGMYLLRGEYQKALKHFLTFESNQENEQLRTIRNEAASLYGNWSEMEKVFLKEKAVFANELKVVSKLKENPNDVIEALKSIEDQVKLWVYAFSSWLFNNKLKEYLIRSDFPPQNLPLFLSNEPKDWEIYKDLVDPLGLFPPSFETISHFSTLSVRQNLIPTTAFAFVHQITSSPQGIVISFTLGKGSYATSFLSHYFNLATKKLPEGFKSEHADLKKLLKNGELSSLLEYFKKVI